MIRFLESFDHYTYNTFTPDNARLLQKWSGFENGGGASGTPRFGSGGYQGFNNHRLYKDLGTNEDTLIAGLAFKATFAIGTPIILIAFNDGSTCQVDVRCNASGLLEVTRNGTVLATGTTVMSSNVWYYVELKATIHVSAGAYEARLQGVTEVSASSVNTRATSNNYANRFEIGGANINAVLSIDDVYLLDNTDSGISGAPNDDFLGDVRIECLFPNGNGATSNLDGSDGNSTDNYLLVDEATNPDDDTTYVESGDVGDKDTYALTNLTPTSGEVFGMQLLAWAKKTDAGSRTAALIARESGGTEEDSADFSLSTSYQLLRDPRDGDPDGAQWTISSVNAAQAGVKVTS